MVKIIIDAEGSVYGRLCSYAAKQALGGNEIVIVNSDKAVMLGNKKPLIEKYKELRAKGGHSLKGPKYSNLTYKMLKRGIRGMLPDHRRGIGKQAFSRIKCYDGIPKEFEGKDMKKDFQKTVGKKIILKELAMKI